jgi:hypothetical protein
MEHQIGSDQIRSDAFDHFLPDTEAAELAGTPGMAAFAS